MSYHNPVLLDECIGFLQIKPSGTYVDATLGGGGHSAAIIQKLDKNGRLIGMDIDTEALEEARMRLESIGTQAEVRLLKMNFRDIAGIINDIPGCDGILFDLGVSSHQFDSAERGFSYNKDATLDMRMDASGDLTAEVIVNDFPEREISRIIRDYGEERWASRIAKFIVERRKNGRIRSTVELSNIIKDAIPARARQNGPHPARRTFQALRIMVNGELDSLKKALMSSISLLKDKARLCVISYHSLEDRIVKTIFAESARGCVCPPGTPQCVCNKRSSGKIITKKPVVASEQEVSINPRSRSAKLRVFERTAYG